jgi:hypothetical protein
MVANPQQSVVLRHQLVAHLQQILSFRKWRVGGDFRPKVLQVTAV